MTVKCDSKNGIAPVDTRWLCLILNSADYTIITTDLDGVIRSVNSDAVDRLGYRAEELIGRHTPSLIHDEDEVIARAAVLSAELKNEIEPGFDVFVAKARLGMVDENEWSYIRKDGSRFTVLLSVTALKDDDGNIEGFLGIGRDITQQKQMEYRIEQQQYELQLANRELLEANDRLRQIVQLDPLTELLNRRGLYARLELDLERIKRHHEPLSLMLLDIDHFKQYNDTHGHLDGDKLLKELSDLLTSQARVTDSVARFGGEEFLLILPQTDEQTALRIAERYRRMIEGTKFVNQSISASFGISTVSSIDQATTTVGLFDLMMEQADKAVYTSKANGRNRVTHFNFL